jgi:hypothetical protein
MNRSFEQLKEVRNLRSLRESSRSGSASLRNSFVQEPVLNIYKSTESILQKGDDQKSKQNGDKWIRDEYLLFTSYVLLVAFEVLMLLKFEKFIDIKWVIVVIPLLVFFIPISGYSYRKLYPLLS